MILIPLALAGGLHFGIEHFLDKERIWHTKIVL